MKLAAFRQPKDQHRRAAHAIVGTGVVLAIIAVASPVLAQTGGSHNLEWHSRDASGGGTSSGGSYSLEATIGQHEAGHAGGGSYGLDTGFMVLPFLPDLGLRGDCNADSVVDAGDISAVILEIFDGDGNLPAAVPGSTFVGDPIGCNANADGTVDAGDISCMILLIFNGQGACGP